MGSEKKIFILLHLMLINVPGSKKRLYFIFSNLPDSLVATNLFQVNTYQRIGINKKMLFLFGTHFNINY